MSKKKQIAMLQQQLQAATNNLNNPGVMAGMQNRPPVIKQLEPGKAGGQGAGTMTTSPYSQWALDLQRQLAQQGAQGLMGMGQQPFNFAPIADWARTNFQQTTIPSIAERFSSLGTGGSQRSSAFPQMLSQAGSNLDQQLAAMSAEYGMKGQALNQGLFGSMLGAGMVPQWQTSYMARQPGFWENLGTGLAGGIGKGIGMLPMAFM